MAKDELNPNTIINDFSARRAAAQKKADAVIASKFTRHQKFVELLKINRFDGQILSTYPDLYWPRKQGRPPKKFEARLEIADTGDIFFDGRCFLAATFRKGELNLRHTLISWMLLTPPNERYIINALEACRLHASIVYNAATLKERVLQKLNESFKNRFGINENLVYFRSPLILFGPA